MKIHTFIGLTMLVFLLILASGLALIAMWQRRHDPLTQLVAGAIAWAIVSLLLLIL